MDWHCDFVGRQYTRIMLAELNLNPHAVAVLLLTVLALFLFTREKSING